MMFMQRAKAATGSFSLLTGSSTPMRYFSPAAAAATVNIPTLQLQYMVRKFKSKVLLWFILTTSGFDVKIWRESRSIFPPRVRVGSSLTLLKQCKTLSRKFRVRIATSTHSRLWPDLPPPLSQPLQTRTSIKCCRIHTLPISLSSITWCTRSVTNLWERTPSAWRRLALGSLNARRLAYLTCTHQQLPLYSRISKPILISPLPQLMLLSMKLLLKLPLPQRKRRRLLRSQRLPLVVLLLIKCAILSSVRHSSSRTTSSESKSSNWELSS